MKNFAILVLLFVAPALAQQKSTTVTFFREDQSMLKQMGQFKKDYVAAGVHWEIYMDGMKLATLHRDRMVTFKIEPGGHDFKTDRSVITHIDVKAGDHLFMRPGFGSKNHGFSAINTFEVVNCTDYLDRVKNIKQIKPSDIFVTSYPPSTFQTICAGK